MKLLTIRAEKILKQCLSNQIVHKYTVLEFCQAANINRGVFYQYYRNINDLFLSVMTIEIRRTLRSNKNESLGKMFYRMLVKIRENKFFYLNMLTIAKDLREFYQVINKELAHAIELYMRPRGAFSVRKIQLVSNGVYAIVLNWILNECKNDIRDIYQCIYLLLKQVEEPEKQV